MIFANAGLNFKAGANGDGVENERQKSVYRSITLATRNYHPL